MLPTITSCLMISVPDMRDIWSALILTVLLLSACGDTPSPMLELRGETMGTSFSIQLVTPFAERDREAVRTEVVDTLSRIEQRTSTYLPDSELSRINATVSTDWIDVSSELCTTIAAAQLVSVLSNGAFDITVAPLVNLWGFGPEGSVEAPPDPDEIADVLSRVGYEQLHTDCAKPALRKDVANLTIDLSAIAKGYAVDELALLLEAREIQNYLVEIGGEMRMRGNNSHGDKWAIAIESPERSSRTVQRIIRLSNTSLATSGDYRNFFEHDGEYFSHTIDARTGYPVVHNAASVTALSESAMLSDAFATALLVLGPDDGMVMAEQNKIAALFLLRDGAGLNDQSSTRFTTRMEVR